MDKGGWTCETETIDKWIQALNLHSLYWEGFPDQDSSPVSWSQVPNCQQDTGDRSNQLSQKELLPGRGLAQ